MSQGRDAGSARDETSRLVAWALLEPCQMSEHRSVEEELKELRARLTVVEVKLEVTEASLRRHWLELFVSAEAREDESRARAADVSSLRREVGDRFGQLQAQVDRGELQLRRLRGVAARVARRLRRRLASLTRART